MPIRIRLAAAFAAATLVVLAGAAVFVYVRLDGDLTESIDEGLRSRADEVAALASLPRKELGSAAPRPLTEAEDTFSQLVAADGRILYRSGGARGEVLSRAELEQARRRTLLLERHVAGIEAGARVLARGAGTGSRQVVVVGASIGDRKETLGSLVKSFVLGGLAAMLAASGVGYLLARAALSPVERMRRRAAKISLEREGERLPLAPARDEIRELGETLNAMLARIEASFERERRFVADASHELRTPIAVLRTEIETALGGGPEHRDALVAALEETDHLAQLAEDLLLIARSADGRIPLRPEPVRVGALLEQARDRFGDRAAALGREIQVQAVGDPRAELDPLRLRQALGNLVDNALRHGSGRVEVAASAAGETLAVRVSDEGNGFTPEMFERFARGSETVARTGAGLGLAIVQAIAEAHGGSVAVSGSTVTMTLPLRAPAASGAAESGP